MQRNGCTTLQTCFQNNFRALSEYLDYLMKISISINHSLKNRALNISFIVFITTANLQRSTSERTMVGFQSKEESFERKEKLVPLQLHKTVQQRWRITSRELRLEECEALQRFCISGTHFPLIHES